MANEDEMQSYNMYLCINDALIDYDIDIIISY